MFIVPLFTNQLRGKRAGKNTCKVSLLREPVGFIYVCLSAVLYYLDERRIAGISCKSILYRIFCASLSAAGRDAAWGSRKNEGELQ